MNFLKILGLVTVTGSFVAIATGAGIYYLVDRNIKNTEINHETSTIIVKNVPNNLDNSNINNREIVPENVLIDSAVNSGVVADNVNKLVVDPETVRSIFDNTSDINPKIQFNGKLVFLKKSGTGESAIYEVKLMYEIPYKRQKKVFDADKIDGNKYDQVNKILDISHQLNVQQAKSKLREIFATPSLLSNIKTKITEKATELKNLFGEETYIELQNIS